MRVLGELALDGELLVDGESNILHRRRLDVCRPERRRSARHGPRANELAETIAIAHFRLELEGTLLGGSPPLVPPIDI